MADKSFGVNELNIIGSGTPTITSPNSGNLNINAGQVAIQTNTTVAGVCTATSFTGSLSSDSTIHVSESTDDSNGYNIPFLTTTGAGGGGRKLQVDNGGLGFKPGTNFLFVQHIQLGNSSSQAGALNIYNASSRLFGEINGIPFGEGNSNNSTNIVIGDTTPSDAAGNNNIALGTQALHGSTGGITNNVAIGYQALLGNDGAYNIALGDNSLSGTGSYNIGLGRQAGHQIAGAQYNIFLGYQPAFSVTDIGHSVAMGYQALYTISDGLISGSGTGNTYGHIAIGYNSQKYFEGIDQNGSPNIAMGIFSLENNVQNGGNTAIGNYALRYLGKGMTATNYTGGYGNTAIGHNAIGGGYSGNFSSTDTFRGDYNTAIGFGSLYLLRSHTSDKNTGLGQGSGDNITTGSNNTCIGAGSDASSATVSNEITLGDSNISTLRCNDTSISYLSDRRDKTDIVNLPAGLEFLNTLRPVKFKWQTRDGNGKDGLTRAGFIAQDLQSAQTNHNYLDLVMDNNPDKLEAKQEHLIPVLVQAIKDLSAKNDALEARIKTLEES